MRPVEKLIVSAVLAAGLAGLSALGDTRPISLAQPVAAAEDPCAAVGKADALPHQVGLDPRVSRGPSRPTRPTDKTASRHAGDDRSYLDSLWAHRARPPRPLASLAPLAASEDVGEISVLQDQDDLILPARPFDLRASGLRFVRNAAGGYDVGRIDGAFRTTPGSALPLEDDDSAAVSVPFEFPFYGKTHTRAFVNSDGNLTFEEEDRASSARDVARMLNGPPRIALFFADLDPTTGGRVLSRAAGGEFTVTWCGVRGFESERTVTAQVTLLPDGAIEMRFGERIDLPEAVVGLSPGRTADFIPVDLSGAPSLTGPGAAAGDAIGERFIETAELDLVALGQRFYQTHADSFDQLVIWTDTRVVPREVFAFETTVANEIRGIGVTTFDSARAFGSLGRLRSLVVMDRLSKYAEDPSQRVNGEDTTLSLIAHETGHRWLARVRFRDHEGEISEALLGRGRAHWSFFFDSDASVMEGNDIAPLGGGSFRTVAAVERFSLLDQYVMGLVSESEVPPFFYVESPVNVSPHAEADSDPRTGVTLNGTRRDVLIEDVVAALGLRQPPAADSPRLHRQAFLFIVSGERTPEPTQVQKLERFRREWEAFFSRATGGRGRVETRLRPPT